MFVDTHHGESVPRVSTLARCLPYFFSRWPRSGRKEAKEKARAAMDAAKKAKADAKADAEKKKFEEAR